MDRRTILALVISIGFLIVWTAVYQKYFARPARPEEQEVPQPEPPQPPTPPKPPGEIKPAPAVEPPKPAEPEPPEQALQLENDHIRIELTNAGAAVRWARLLDYKVVRLGRRQGIQSTPDVTRLIDLYKDMYADSKPGPQTELFLTGPIEPGTCSLALYDPNKALPLDTRRYKVVRSESDRVEFESTFAPGVIVRKVFSLQPGKRHVDVAVELVNTTAEKLAAQYAISTAAGVIPEVLPGTPPDETPLAELSTSDTISASVGAQTTAGKIVAMTKPASKLAKGDFAYSENDVLWVAVQNNYFAAILRPKDDPSGRFVFGADCRVLGVANATAQIKTVKLDIPPGKTLRHEYLWYLGPKDSATFAASPEYQAFEPIINIRGIDAIGKLFLGLLWLLHTVFRNYGIAIIAMTVIVRVAMHPLSRKSQTSMHRMQKLQPKMKELREKYKDDKTRMNQEVMKLYREEGVNPMGGCLPMVIQLPILIGLWGALNASVSLRQATFHIIPFTGWISDLSAPDALLILPSRLPLIGWSINLLPLLMIAAMFWQQKLTPKSEDPQAQQTQKMMQFMPVIFGFLFYSMASGLVLYFLVSTAIGVAETEYIRKQLDKTDNAKPAPITSAPRPWESRKTREAKKKR